MLSDFNMSMSVRVENVSSNKFLKKVFHVFWIISLIKRLLSSSCILLCHLDLLVWVYVPLCVLLLRLLISYIYWEMLQYKFLSSIFWQLVVFVARKVMLNWHLLASRERNENLWYFLFCFFHLDFWRNCGWSKGRFWYAWEESCNGWTSWCIHSTSW